MPASEGGLHWDVRASFEERRDQILRSLAAFMRERRLASLTMRDIAGQLGLVKGNLYYYFKSKQDILYHCHVKCIAIARQCFFHRGPIRSQDTRVAADDCLRREGSRSREAAHVPTLTLCRFWNRERIFPTRVVEIIDVIRKRYDVGALRELAEQRISGRTGAAALGGEQFYDDRLSCRTLHQCRRD